MPARYTHHVLSDVPISGKMRPAELTPVRRRGLVDEVVQKLEHGIRSGAFEIGTKLPPEPQLQHQLGVGRTTVREAVKVLAHAGMLEVRQGDGTYVRATTSASHDLVERLGRAHARDILAVRRGLDLEMARVAAVVRTDEDIARMSELIQRMRRVLTASKPSTNEFADAEAELQLALAASSHNPVLVDLTSSFSIALRRVSGELAAMSGAMEACSAFHERVFDAVKDRNAARAQEATMEYLDWVSSRLSEMDGSSESV